MIPWTLARAVGGYLVARNLGPKWPKKCPKIKPRRLFGSAVPLLLSLRALETELVLPRYGRLKFWLRAEGGGGGVGPFCTRLENHGFDRAFPFEF